MPDLLFYSVSVQFSSVSRSVLSDSLQLHGLHPRLGSGVRRRWDKQASFGKKRQPTGLCLEASICKEWVSFSKRPVRSLQLHLYSWGLGSCGMVTPQQLPGPQLPPPGRTMGWDHRPRPPQSAGRVGVGERWLRRLLTCLPSEHWGISSRFLMPPIQRSLAESSGAFNIFNLREQEESIPYLASFHVEAFPMHSCTKYAHPSQDTPHSMKKMEPVKPAWHLKLGLLGPQSAWGGSAVLRRGAVVSPQGGGPLAKALQHPCWVCGVMKTWKSMLGRRFILFGDIEQ